MKPMIPCFGCGCQDIAPKMEYSQLFSGPLRYRLSCAKCGRHTVWYRPEQFSEMEDAWNEEQIAPLGYDMYEAYRRIQETIKACNNLRQSIETISRRDDRPQDPDMQTAITQAGELADSTLEALVPSLHKVEDWIWPDGEEDEYPEDEEEDDDDY